MFASNSLRLGQHVSSLV
uniref:Uncharacterized protein n=1 Tax=Arundo donax TaxID=35708 RepID=A0A0A9B5E9_ARUDO